MNEPTAQLLVFGAVVLAISLIIERIARKKLRLDRRDPS
jgi:hypothetical protein